MGIFEFFKTRPPAPEVRESPSIRKIIEKIDHLPEDQAKFLASFAYILGRVAHADLDISEAETKEMEKIVKDFAGMDEDMAILIVQIAKSQNILLGATDNYLVTREFKNISDKEQREKLLHCLFAVAGSDEEITNVESEEIRKISKELGFSAQEFIQIRLHYRDKLSLLKNLP